MKPFSLLLGLILAIGVVAVLLLVFGVNFTSDVMTYNPAKEITVGGTITDVEDYACPASEGEIGSHLTLKTADKKYEVHLAAARIMRSVKFNLKPGQQIQVKGAQVSFRGKPGLLAREITRGQEVFTLRDPNGKLLLSQQ